MRLSVETQGIFLMLFGCFCISAGVYMIRQKGAGAFQRFAGACCVLAGIVIDITGIFWEELV